VVALQITDSLGAKECCILGALDAFGHCTQAETVGEAQEMAQKNSIFGAVC
jgi:hypothetical protein